MAWALVKLHMQSHRMHVDIPRDASVITKEHEYMPQDATDDLRKAVGIGNPTNRTVHFTVAILRLAERHTSLEFISMTMSKRAAGECLRQKKSASIDRSTVFA